MTRSHRRIRACVLSPLHWSWPRVLGSDVQSYVPQQISKDGGLFRSRDWIIPDIITRVRFGHGPAFKCLQ